MTTLPSYPEGMPNTATPTTPAERQTVLDALRGFALLGILLVNVQLMAGPQVIEAALVTTTTAFSTVERVLGGLIGWLVAGKFISSFAILFGAGAAIIAQRAHKHGRAPRRLLTRRYLLLAFAGLVHMIVLFPGDVLFLYAVTGFCLLAFLGRSNRTVTAWIVALLAVSVVGLTMLALADAGLDPDLAFEAEITTAIGSATTAYATGDYGAVMTWNGLVALVVQSSALLSVPWTLALFLIGMLGARTGLALHPQAHRETLKRFARYALPIGLLLNLPLLLTGPVVETAITADVSTAMLIGVSIATTLGAPVLAVGYLTALAARFAQRGTTGALARRLAALGQIALTGYLMQSIAAVLIFFVFTRFDNTAIFGEPILGMLAFVAGVWVVLLLLAPLWTARFTSGPFEWLWRWATYGSRPAFRRR